MGKIARGGKSLPGWNVIAAIALPVMLSASNIASADPANCDSELNEAQKTQRTFCTSFAPCRFVFSIFDTCVQTKTWLLGFGNITQQSDMSLSAVESAARRMAVMEIRPDEDGPSIFNCLPGNFDRAPCRQYLGIDKMPIKVAAEPRKRTADVERRARMLALYQQEEQSRLRLSGPPASAVNALAACAEAKARSDRAATCQRAQQQVAVCNTARQEWSNRKMVLLAEIEQATPGAGKEYAAGISPLRGLGRQANDDEMWNDTVKRLGSMEIAACPATLPNTFLTPDQALAAWAAEEGKGASVIARCDSMSRAVFDAIDEEQVIKATSLTDPFETACAGEQQTYAERVLLARERIAVLRNAQAAATAAPKRSTGYGASLFKGAISQAEAEARDPSLRAARLQLEQRASATAEPDAGTDNSMSLLTGLLNVAKGAVDARAAQAGVRAAASAQQLAQLQAQQQALSQTQQTQQANAYKAEAARADAFNKKAAEASRYYAPLQGCAKVITRTNSVTPHCIQNTCNQTVEVHFSGGMLTNPPGNCWPVSGTPIIFGVCEKNDFYDKARQQCKR